MLAIGQQRHQSATASSLATHAANALVIDVISVFVSYIK